MQKLLNPKWLFLINTLPVAVLVALILGRFNIAFGISLGTLGILNFAYAVYLIVKKKDVSVLYGLIALICYIAFLYLFRYNAEKIIPFRYIILFLAPTLAYSIFIFVIHFTKEAEENSVGCSFFILTIFVVAICFFELVAYELPLPEHIHNLFSIVSALVFNFFLFRTSFIITQKEKYQLIWKIPIAIVFPLLGLEAHNEKGFDTFFEFVTVGYLDLSNPWFYILALFNGIFICLPSLENKFYRLTLFALRSITCFYTVFLVLIFLQALPLYLVVSVFGISFFMLIPMLLFIVHISEISKDFEYLKTWFSKNILIAILMLGFLVIPACVLLVFLQQLI